MPDPGDPPVHKAGGEMEERETILVVDNENAVAELLKRGLIAAGYNVVIALDGDNALKQVEKEAPDLILLDINMPGMDGYQVCRRIRDKKVYDQIPVIMLTGLKESSQIVQALHAGADDYIFKSVADGKLVRKIEDMLALARSGKLPSSYFLKKNGRNGDGNED